MSPSKHNNDLLGYGTSHGYTSHYQTFPSHSQPQVTLNTQSQQNQPNQTNSNSTGATMGYGFNSESNASIASTISHTQSKTPNAIHSTQSLQNRIVPLSLSADYDDNQSQSQGRTIGRYDKQTQPSRSDNNNKEDSIDSINDRHIKRTKKSVITRASTLYRNGNKINKHIKKGKSRPVTAKTAHEYNQMQLQMQMQQNNYEYFNNYGFNFNNTFDDNINNTNDNRNIDQFDDDDDDINTTSSFHIRKSIYHRNNEIDNQNNINESNQIKNNENSNDDGENNNVSLRRIHSQPIHPPNVTSNFISFFVCLNCMFALVLMV